MKDKLNSLAIVLIGNELLNGAIQDKNAKLLLEKLSEIRDLKLEVVILADDALRISEAIRRLELTYQVVVTSGGLGPTTDDITVESISKTFGVELVQNLDAKARLEEKYKKRGRPLTQNSFKQILFPKNATILPNDVGTADSCIIHTTNSHIACFPGVPKEFEFFINGTFWNWLNQNFDLGNSPAKAEMRFFGLSEAFIGSQIELLKLPPEINIAYRPQFPEILVIISSNELNSIEIEKVTGDIVKTFGKEFVFSNNNHDTLPHALYQTLLDSNLTLATAESCTGGRIASEITKIPGSSHVFNGGLITYSNEMKKNFLDIDPEILNTRGAVSEEVAMAMAEATRIKTKSSYAISTTGVAGPGGGTERKPVGLIYIGISCEEYTKCFKLELPWERSRNQIYTSWYGMNLIWRSIKGYKMNWETM